MKSSWGTGSLNSHFFQFNRFFYNKTLRQEIVRLLESMMFWAKVNPICFPTVSLKEMSIRKVLTLPNPVCLVAKSLKYFRYRKLITIG